jgi:hypothetical protein
VGKEVLIKEGNTKTLAQTIIIRKENNKTLVSWDIEKHITKKMGHMLKGILPIQGQNFRIRITITVVY